MKKDNRKKILIISGYFYPEEFIINDLAKEWDRSGYDVTVLTQVPSYPFGKVYKGYKNKIFSTEYWEKIKIFHFYTVQGYHKSLILKVLNYIYFIISGCIIALFIGNKFDRVFIYQIGPLTLAIPGVLIKKIYKKEVTIWTQDLWPDTVYSYGFKKSCYLHVFLNWIVKKIYKNCDNIFVSCKGFINKINYFVPDKTINYLPNWSLVNSDNKKKVFLSNKFNFTFAGNIGKVQNLENVIKGFSLVSSNNNKVQLNIIGDGSNLENLKKMVVSKKIRNVVFWGRKKLEDMSLYFKASDVLIISLNNSPVFELTVPAKFQAYLDSNKPIYSIMKGEVSRMVKEYKIGITVDPDDLESIKNGFIKLYKMKKSDRLSFVKNTKILSEGIFNKDKIIKKMTDIVIH